MAERSGAPEEGGSGADESDEAFTSRLAARVVARGLTVPAILVLESSKPLSVVASQLLIALEPMVGLLVNTPDTLRLARLLAERGYIETLLVAIENREAAVTSGGSPL
jgi:hypothetical protein